MLPLNLYTLIKYVIEGLAVGLAVYLVAGQKSTVNEILLLGLTASVTFMILDLFTSGIGLSARQGTGFGLGFRQIGMGEGFSGQPMDVVASKEPNYQYTVGQDAYGDTIGYNAEIQEYGVQSTNKDAENKIHHMAELPYRFANTNKKTCPQSPVAGTPTTEPYGATNTGSRWMGWVEDGEPINCNTQDYKIVPGLYSKYIVQPGYREGIKTANGMKTDLLAPTIWPTTNPLDKNHFILKQPFASSCEKKNDISKMNNRQHNYIENFENPQIVRLSGVVYSGDIVNLMAANRIMQRGLVNSQIIFDLPLENVKTNLSKVRIVLADGVHDPRKQAPIKYGELVYIKHNAMINNNNENRYVKYGERLQSHQDGPLFRSYRIFNKSDLKSQAYIKYSDDVIIARGDQTNGDQIYLKVEADKTVSCEATVGEATVFTIVLERVYELYDRNLCVCPGETIYP